MYSQNKEEEKIVEYFTGRSGRFLDIGAFDGKTFSNSLRLAELGWGGVCVEPSPEPFAKLESLHKDNKTITTIEAIVGTKDGVVDFYDSDGDAVSTTDASHKAKWERGSKVKFNKIQVVSMTPASLLNLIGTEFDFVNVDTENTNFETLKGLVDAGLQFDLLCVEHDNRHPEIIAMFPGCQPIEVNAENIIIYYKQRRK